MNWLYYVLQKPSEQTVRSTGQKTNMYLLNALL